MFAVWVIVGVVIALAAIVYLAIWVRRRPAANRARLDVAREVFHHRREYLELKFFELASASGKPRGLRWMDCDFDDDVAYARERRTGELLAFVAVTIRFEAVEGGPMEEVEAVDNLRAATAVFSFSKNLWQTNGRVIQNMNPTEAIEFYRDRLVMVGQELGDTA